MWWKYLIWFGLGVYGGWFICALLVLAKTEARDFGEE